MELTDTVLKTMSEKLRLEYYAVYYLVAEYNKLFDGAMEFISLQEPPKPDTLCLVRGQEIGVEVAHLYGSELDAERLLGRKRRIPRSETEYMSNRLIPLNERILGKLNDLLEDKATKKYSQNPVWLIVRVALPLWNKEEFEKYKDEIIIPKEHPFQQIWLLCESDRDLLLLYDAA